VADFEITYRKENLALLTSTGTSTDLSSLQHEDENKKTTQCHPNSLVTDLRPAHVQGSALPQHKTESQDEPEPEKVLAKLITVNVHCLQGLNE